MKKTKLPSATDLRDNIADAHKYIAICTAEVTAKRAIMKTFSPYDQQYEYTVAYGDWLSAMGRQSGAELMLHFLLPLEGAPYMG